MILSTCWISFHHKSVGAICMCVLVCMHVYACVHVCACVYACECQCTWMHVHVCECVCVCVHVDIVLVCSFVSLTSNTHIGLSSLLFGQAGLTIDWNWASQGSS